MEIAGRLPEGWTNGSALAVVIAPLGDLEHHVERVLPAAHVGLRERLPRIRQARTPDDTVTETDPVQLSPGRLRKARQARSAEHWVLMARFSEWSGHSRPVRAR